MKTFPMFLRMDGRRVVICGGGDEAVRKARLALKTEAEIVVCAETLDPELAALAREARLRHVRRAFRGTFRNAALVFIATGDDRLDLKLARKARKAGAVVNVVDRPDHCDAFTPSIVDRDPVVVAIGTEGTAPVLGRRIRTSLETSLPPRLGALAALAGRLRPTVEQALPPARRRAFWEWAFTGAPFGKHAAGDEKGAEELMREAAASGEFDRDQGRLTLVGAGPGARDLLTLRAVQRLQEADVVLYDRLVDPDILELARRDADRIYVGKAVGACAYPQDRINGMIVDLVSAGKHVVRLKSGDPSVFGRACEEIGAARRASVPVEIVPGITAASAAAASLLRPLTERGETDTLVLTTGTSKPGDADPDRAFLARPGTSVAFYMAVERAETVERDLRLAGVPEACPVDIVASASLPHERRVSTTLRALASTINREGLSSPAILFLRYPKLQAIGDRGTHVIAAE